MKIVSLDSVPEEGVSHNPEIRKQVILRRGDVPHLTNFTRSSLAPGQTASPHAHADMFEVFFVASGEGRLVLDGQEYALRAGVSLLIEPGERHEISNTGTRELVLLYFGIEGQGE